MPWQMPIQDGRQLHLLHQGQEHHKVIDALTCYLKLFFHALQYARKFRFCLAHYANGELYYPEGVNYMLDKQMLLQWNGETLCEVARRMQKRLAEIQLE